MIRRRGTKDGTYLSPGISKLAMEVLGSKKKKDIAYTFFLLSLNDKDIRCQVTPQIIEALCNGNIIPKKPFKPAAFSHFS